MERFVKKISRSSVKEIPERKCYMQFDGGARGNPTVIAEDSTPPE